MEFRKFSSRQHSLVYNPALEGLRGVAVFLVFLTHLGHYPGGTFGVDIFFVLSGYLITEVIHNSHDGDQFLGVFYFRRFIRLFPALVVLCITAVGISVTFGFNNNIYKDALSSVLYAQSWTSSFSDGFSLYLGQTWSLSVEEQFYIIWPFVWILSARTKDARITLFISLILLAAVMSWEIYLSLSGATYSRVYFAPDTRSEAILIGSMGSIVRRMPATRKKLGWFLESASVIPLAAIIGISAFLHWNVYNSLMVSGLSIVVILGLATRSGSIEAKLLSFPPLMMLGRISYSFYLWHYPILLLLELHFQMSFLPVFVVGLASSLFISVASYTIVEQPARKFRSILSREMQSRAGFLALSGSVFSITGGLLYFQWSDIQNVVQGTKLEVTGYGPKEYRLGDRGPLQPDGSLVMWISLNRRPDMRSKATVSGLKTTVDISSRAIDIVIPPSLLKAPGKNVIQVFTSHGKVELPKMELDVMAST